MPHADGAPAPRFEVKVDSIDPVADGVVELVLVDPHGRPLPEADQVELAASVLEAVAQEEGSAEALRGMLSALGHLVYGASVDGELADLLCALEAGATVEGKTGFPGEKLVKEVGELLGKGFRRP